MSVNIRPYQPTDKPACLAVFDSNVPKYFSVEEGEEFSAFLDKPSCVYFVVEQAGEIVGCGGYYLASERKEAGMCWGMVHNHLHGTGLGKQLLLMRLNSLVQHPEVEFIRLDTSQHTFGFFEKLGFVTQQITPNGYWEGLDRYDMKLELNSANRQQIQNTYRESQP